MRTKYAFDTKKFPVVDLDEISQRKDCDILLVFGGAELVIQYRQENAGRVGHPFIDIVTVPASIGKAGDGDEPMTVDLCDNDGKPLRVPKTPVYQILLGQRVRC